jgi:hypothetical protein
MDVGDEPDAEGIDNISRRELPAINLSRDCKHRREQERKDSEEERLSHYLVEVRNVNLPQSLDF